MKGCAVGMGSEKGSGMWWQEWWHTLGGVPSFTQSPLPMLWRGWCSKRHGEDSWTPTATWKHGICVPHSSHQWGTRRGQGHPAAGLEQRALPRGYRRADMERGWGHTASGWAVARGPHCPIGAAEGSSSGACVHSHPTGSASATSCCQGQNHLDDNSGRLGRSRPLALKS